MNYENFTKYINLQCTKISSLIVHIITMWCYTDTNVHFCFWKRSSSLKLQFNLFPTYLLMYVLYNRVIISTPLFKYVWSLKQRADPLTWNIHQGKEILKEVDSWRIFWRGQLCSEVYKSVCLVYLFTTRELVHRYIIFL